MKSITAAVTVAGAALFAQTAYAQLPPIVIKVRYLIDEFVSGTFANSPNLCRAQNSSMKIMGLNCKWLPFDV